MASKFTRQTVSGVQPADDRTDSSTKEYSKSAPEPRDPAAGWSASVGKAKHDQGEG